MFETVVRLGPSDRQLTVPADEADGDGLNFLAGKSLDFIRDRAMEAPCWPTRRAACPT